MTPEEITVLVIDALNAENISYMLVGSYSSNFYSNPRSTQDVDFVLKLEPNTISFLTKRLGAQFQLDRQLSFELVTATNRYVLRLPDNPFYVELFVLSDDAHDQERFSRRRRERILGRDVFIPTMEDVIVTKLRWSRAGRREKDAEDVKNIIAVQGDRIDWGYVASWCDRHGTRDLLDELSRGSI